MCERTEALQEMRQAAECLERACVTPLQKLYEEAAKEPIPEDMQALLNRLK
jgi:hypothetical protein